MGQFADGGGCGGHRHRSQRMNVNIIIITVRRAVGQRRHRGGRGRTDGRRRLAAAAAGVVLVRMVVVIVGRPFALAVAIVARSILFGGAELQQADGFVVQLGQVGQAREHRLVLLEHADAELGGTEKTRMTC